MEKQYKIDGMSCHHCVMAVENELKNAGFDEYEVKIGSAKVRFDGSQESDEKIVAAIEEAGYKVAAE